jgi:hypothetical protein
MTTVFSRLAAPSAALLLTAGCAHAPAPEFSQRIRQERCEDAASFLRANRRGPPIESRLRQAVALPLSYVLTGATYTLEATAVVGGGIVGAVVLCSPILMLEGAAGGDGSASGACLGTMTEAFLSEAKLPGAGRWVRDATDGWRCSDTTPLSEDLRAIAECYAWRGGADDLRRAKRQLAVILEARDLLRCASPEERVKVERANAWIAERLAEEAQPAE